MKIRFYLLIFSLFFFSGCVGVSSKGIFGWSGYHNTHFWIDPKNKIYGLFMSRSREFNFSIPTNLKKIVYSIEN